MRYAVHMVLLVWASTAHAETLTGRVVGISNGTTLTVLVARQEVKVHLADIDAPEIKQAFGSRSKQALSDLCLQKDARIETQGRVRHDRTLATVYCAGRHANAEQVWQGMAWVLDRYARPDSPLYVLQDQARAARRGLWSQPHPTPPWEWRKHEWDRKGVAPSGVESSPVIQTQPQQPKAAPQNWVCDRREVKGQVAIECGWR